MIAWCGCYSPCLAYRHWRGRVALVLGNILIRRKFLRGLPMQVHRIQPLTPCPSLIVPAGVEDLTATQCWKENPRTSMSQCVCACLCKYMHILTDLRRSLLSTLVTLCVPWGHGCSYDMGPLLKHLKSESPVAHYEMWRLRKDRTVVANL